MTDSFEEWFANRTMKDVSDTDLFGNLARQAWNASRASLLAELASEGMVEEVARAICKAMGTEPDLEAYRWNESAGTTVPIGSPAWKDYIPDSQAALLAVRKKLAEKVTK